MSSSRPQAVAATAGLHAAERRVIAVLAAVMSVRILGLFMLLPVMALYARGFDGATTALVGLATGIYGMTQAALQIPFGMLSDRFGRRIVIQAGLVLFTAGSALAAVSDTLGMLIAARALQGAGAISAATTALLADRTREAMRTRAMAIVGVTIGASFVLSLVLGPLLAARIGVAGLMWLTALLGGVSLTLVSFMPAGEPVRAPRAAAGLSVSRLRDAMGQRPLLALDAGVFILHFVLTAIFVTLPLGLADAGVDAQRHWQIYLAAMGLSLLGTIPLVLAAERARGAFAGPAAVLALATGCTLLALASPGVAVSVAALTMFFAGFNYAEARLPARVSQQAPVADRGAALGLYSTSQFLGAFAGGVLGGVLLGALGPASVYLVCAGLLVAWLPIARTL